MSNVATSARFKDNVGAALADPLLQNALKFVEVNLIKRRREVVDRLPAPDRRLKAEFNRVYRQFDECVKP